MGLGKHQRYLARRLLAAVGAGVVLAGISCSGETTTVEGNSSSSSGGQCLNSAEEFCLSVAGMEEQARWGVSQLPPTEPIRSEEEIASGWDSQGCMRPDWIHDSCCNPALGPGRPSGDSCCYQSCFGACCGRALVIDGEAVTAALWTRGDWLEPPSEPDARIDPDHAAALAKLWREDALLEHASIASFARFTLQLMALGAPASLVEAAQSAALDEVEHAKLCFSLASQLDGALAGPGKLPQAAAPVSTSLADVVVATIFEGCVCETLAAAVALEQASVAQHPRARAALERIASDEARHAELAWRFVAWALGRADAHTRRRARQAFDDALASERPEPPTPSLPEATLHAFGRLTPSEQRRLETLTLSEAIAPAARALFKAGRLGSGLRPNA